MTMLVPTLLLTLVAPPAEPEPAPAAPPVLTRPRPLGPGGSGGIVVGGAGLGLAIAEIVRVPDLYNHESLIVTPARKVALGIDYLRLLEQEGEDSVQDTVWYIRQDTTAALRDRHGVEVVEDAGGPAIVVGLSWIQQEESVYGVTIQTRRPGEDPRELATFECECIDSGLTEAVLQRLPAALAQLEGQAVRPGSRARPEPERAGAGTELAVADPPGGEQNDHPAASSTASSKAPQTPTTSAPEHRPRPLSPVGMSGVVLGTAGLGLAVTGIVRMLEPETRMIDPHNEERIIVTSTRRQGGALLGAGLGVATMSAVIVAVDLTVLRKRRERRITAAPMLRPSASGMQLRVRF